MDLEQTIAEDQNEAVDDCSVKNNNLSNQR